MEWFKVADLVHSFVESHLVGGRLFLIAYVPQRDGVLQEWRSALFWLAEKTTVRFPV